MAAAKVFHRAPVDRTLRDTANLRKVAPLRVEEGPGVLGLLTAPPGMESDDLRFVAFSFDASRAGNLAAAVAWCIATFTPISPSTCTVGIRLGGGRRRRLIVTGDQS